MRTPTLALLLALAVLPGANDARAAQPTGRRNGPHKTVEQMVLEDFGPKKPSASHSKRRQRRKQPQKLTVAKKRELDRLLDKYLYPDPPQAADSLVRFLTRASQSELEKLNDQIVHRLDKLSPVDGQVDSGLLDLRLEELHDTVHRDFRRRIAPWTAKDVFDSWAGSVVSVEATGSGGVRSGTGFFLGGYTNVMISAFHVIAGTASVKGITSGGEELKAGGVVWADRELDLVALTTDEPKAKPKGLFPEDDVRRGTSVGDPVYVIGDPQGLRSTLSTGVLSGIRPSLRRRTALSRSWHVIYQITAPVSQGSSGSPVFNKYGQAIGVVTSQVEDGQNLNFCVPLRYLHIPEKELQAPLAMEEWAVYSR